MMAMGVVALASVSGQAQSAQCPAGTVNAFGVPDAARASQDACQQSIDLFQYMAPQLSTALAGGNATLGIGGTLGGLGHFSVGLRANAVAGTLPKVDQLTPLTTGAQRRQFPTSDQLIPLATADLAVGVFQGVPMGLTNVGGVDLLASATYIPSVNESSVSVDPNTHLKLGYGVRIGALQESIVIPGVSITYLKRDLPKTLLSAQSGSDSLIVRDLDVETSAWRLVVSKHLVLFGLAAGIGQDKYNSSATTQAVVNRAIIGVNRSVAIAQSQDLTRTNMFADVSINLPLLNIVGEIGQVSGGTITTFNSFADKNADASRMYASVGLRFGW
jgi:hypothetical protein